MRRMMMGAFSIAFLLTGCSGGDGQQVKEEQSAQKIEPLQVDLSIEPKNAEAGQKVQFQAVVSQGSEKVNDASEVKFEVGKTTNEEESEMLTADSPQEGTYTVSKAFDEEGSYYVVAHVTARGLHTMPRDTFTVGDTSKEEEGHAHDEEAGHHHELSIAWQGETEWKANREAVLTSAVEFEGEPLSGADVSYEIWLEGAEKPEWVNAEEAENGVYSVKHLFKEAGSYKVIIHVRKDDLHDHKEQSISVIN